MFKASSAPSAGLDVIKCNADDAQRYLNRELVTDDEFSCAALELASALGIEQAAIITRGSQRRDGRLRRQ